MPPPSASARAPLFERRPPLVLFVCLCCFFRAAAAANAGVAGFATRGISRCRQDRSFDQPTFSYLARKPSHDRDGGAGGDGKVRYTTNASNMAYTEGLLKDFCSQSSRNSAVELIMVRV
jgi:hypothetical protein